MMTWHEARGWRKIPQVCGVSDHALAIRANHAQEDRERSRRLLFRRGCQRYRAIPARVVSTATFLKYMGG